MSPHVAVGDVIRCTRLYVVDGESDKNARYPLWGIIQQSTVLQSQVIWMHTERPPCKFDKLTPSLVATIDRYTIVGPDEWPDEVVLAVAKYRMTGEVE